jgi:MFS transporter, ACS family, hexuronate transporter
MIKKTNYRWLIVIFLFTICVLNYIDRDSISFSISAIAKEFHLNTLDMGWIMGIFGAGYLVTTFFSGFIVDRTGSRTLLSISVVFWSIAMFMMGLTPVVLIIYLARLLLGLAEGPNFPSMTRTLADWLPQKEQSAAFAWSLASVPFGLMIGAPIVSQLITHFSWRIMFVILGCISLLWVPLWLIFFKNHPSEVSHVNEAELNLIENNKPSSEKPKVPFKTACRFIFSNPTLLVNYYAFFVFGYFLYFMMSWLPTYLKSVDHMSITSAGWFSTLPWGLSVITLIGLGYVSDWLQQKTGKARIAKSYVIFFTQLIAGLLLIPVILVHQQTLSLALLTVSVAVLLGGNSAYFTVNVDVAHEYAGSALGVMDACFAASTLLAPVLSGFFINLTGQFNMPIIILIGLCLSSALLVWCFHRPERYGCLSDSSANVALK